MTDSIGVRELRQYASTYLKRVKDGESLTVTERGRPIARLVPIGQGAADWRQEWIEQGRLTPADRQSAFRWSAAPTFDLPPGVESWSELLDEVRRDRP